MLGISLGNVYTTLNGPIDDYLKIAQTSLAFGIISFVYSAVTIVLSFIPKTNNITVGKFNLIKLLSVCGNVLYVPFFALGCATISKSKEIGMDNGNFSGLVIAFSIVFAAISIGSLIADILLCRNVPAYFEAINSNAQAKADREEHKRQMLAERRANAERILAKKGIYEPKKVEHPNKKLGAMMFANFKICPLVYLIAFGFVSACILYIYCVSGYIGGWILFMLIGSIALSVAALIALVCPVKIYSQNERKKIVRRFRSQMLFISFNLFLSTIAFLMGSFWLIQGTIHLLDIDGMLLIGG